MKLQELESKITGLNLHEEIYINNNNELYIKSSKDNFRKLFKELLFTVKLNFAAEFCREEDNSVKSYVGNYVINAVLINRKYGYFVNLFYKTSNSLVSIQDIVYASHGFEREISDLFGVSIESAGNGLADGKESAGFVPDTRNIVKHEVWQKDVYPLRKSFKFGNKVKIKNETEKYKFKEVAGDGAYQIAVGPVHAGIIEPGHFRFSVMGEPVENLEIRLMYKHRGIEKLCENVDANNLNLVFERVAGESTAAYAEAYALLIEKLLKHEVPYKIKIVRVVLLELERMYNFLGDIAGICVDIGFSYPAKKYEHFAELVHQLCERISGSRFLRGTIVPCGINIEFGSKEQDDILNIFEIIRPRLREIINITMDSVSFLDRVEATGIVKNKTAVKLCMTGIVGRTAGIKYDVRNSFKYETYDKLKGSVKTEIEGGVLERYKLKIDDIRNSFNIITEALEFLNNAVSKETQHISFEESNVTEGQEAFAAVETVKGELVVYARVGKNNKFDRVYFKTPSFTNWEGLSYAVLGEIVPDFPLCNKSFNMSYSENDR
jgi:Ni,Fe-hydrogenase III large subunit/Ni,Fe-hydrogenase III component G